MQIILKKSFFFFFSPPLCLGQWDDVQHRETRVPAVRQGAPGEHLWGPNDLQSPPGGNPVTLWQRGQPGIRAPPQWPGLLWGGMSPWGEVPLAITHLLFLPEGICKLICKNCFPIAILENQGIASFFFFNQALQIL